MLSLFKHLLRTYYSLGQVMGLPLLCCYGPVWSGTQLLGSMTTSSNEEWNDMCDWMWCATKMKWDIDLLISAISIHHQTLKWSELWLTMVFIFCIQQTQCHQQAIQGSQEGKEQSSICQLKECPHLKVRMLIGLMSLFHREYGTWGDIFTNAQPCTSIQLKPLLFSY